MSEIATLITHGLTVVGQGLATASDLSGVRPRQKASLYADPLSWLVFEAVERALGSLARRRPRAVLTVGATALLVRRTHGGQRPIERLGVVCGGGAEAGELADVLEGGGADLVIGRGLVEDAEGLDASTHAAEGSATRTLTPRRGAPRASQ